MKIRDVKTKVYTMTGTAQRYQQLILKRSEGDLISLSDRQTLKDYGAETGMELEVFDQNQYSVTKAIGEKDWQDMPDVDAPDDKYFACHNNVVFQIQKKMQDPQYKDMVEKQMQMRAQIQQKELDDSKTVHIGQTVYFNNIQATIKYIGTVKYLGAGIFYGLELSQGLDEGNGEFAGIQYYNCKEGRGVFAKHAQIKFQNVVHSEDESCSEL